MHVSDNAGGLVTVTNLYPELRFLPTSGDEFSQNSAVILCAKKKNLDRFEMSSLDDLLEIHLLEMMEEELLHLVKIKIKSNMFIGSNTNISVFPHR